jgi:hypothetical protein
VLKEEQERGWLNVKEFTSLREEFRRSVAYNSVLAYERKEMPGTELMWHMSNDIATPEQTKRRLSVMECEAAYDAETSLEQHNMLMAKRRLSLDKGECVDRMGVRSFMIEAEPYDLKVPLLTHFAEETSFPQPTKILFQDAHILIFPNPRNPKMYEVKCVL